MADAKLVRTYAKAGQVANFVAITGNSHRYQWMSISIIKQMLERGIRVYEKLEEGFELEDGSTEIELTLGNENAGVEANYNVDNGGEPFDANDKSIVVVQNLEEQRIEELNLIKEEQLAELGMKIKEDMEKVYEDDTVENDDNTESVNDNTGGTGASTGTVTGGGASFNEDDEDEPISSNPSEGNDIDDGII